MAVSLRFDRAAIGVQAPGQAAEFDELYRAQLARLRAFLRNRLPDVGLVDDVAQETFLRAYRSFDRFEPDRPAWPWLKAIASNACVDMLRKRATARTDETDDLDQAMAVVDHDADPHARFNVRERQRGMRDAMASMPARQRRVLTLADVEGWDVREVAAIEGTTAESAKSILKRARATFRRTYLTLADERGLLAGAPIGAALARMRTLRATVGRRLVSPMRLMNSAAPYLTDAAVAALISGALVYAPAGGATAVPAASVSTSIVGSVASASANTAAPSAAAVAGSANAAPSHSGTSEGVGPASPTIKVKAGHAHEGRFEEIDLKTLSKYGVPVHGDNGVYWDCETSAVSTAFCDAVDRLPNP